MTSLHRKRSSTILQHQPGTTVSNERLFPNEVVHKFVKLMDLTFTVPNVHEWNQLPVADIVKTCQTPPPCSTPEQEKLCATLSPDNAAKKSRKISFTTVNTAESGNTPEASRPKAETPAIEQTGQETKQKSESFEQKERPSHNVQCDSLKSEEEITLDTQDDSTPTVQTPIITVNRKKETI